jgi:hypothetical protein
MDKLVKGTSCSIIRQADGERAFIRHYQGQPPAGFLQDKVYLNKYGLTGCDLKAVGQGLLQAGAEADYLSIPIAGIWVENFEMYSYYQARRQFTDQHFPTMWQAANRVKELIRESPPIILHHKAADIAEVLMAKHRVLGIRSFPFCSWRDQEEAKAAVCKSGCQIALVAGGPSSKLFMVKLAKELNKIVIDVGSALTDIWCR